MGYFKERLYQQYVILFIFYFMSMAALSSLITVYMRDIGKNGSEISFILILSNIIALIIQGLIGYSNEQWGTRKTVTIYVLISAVISMGLFFFTGNWLFGLVYGLANAITLGLAPLFDVLAANSPYRFGQIRLWGTIGYAAGQQISGIIYDFLSPKSIFILYLACYFASIVFLYTLPKPEQPIVSSEQPAEKKEEISGGHTIRNIFQNKLFITYLLLAFIIFGTNTVNTSYLPLLLTDTGAPVAIVSTTLTVALFAEVIAMAFSHRFMDHFTNKQLLLAILFLSGTEYLINSLSSDFLVLSIATVLTKFFASGTFIMLNLKMV
ncbi:MAG TPA: MFS transporter, partial [Trichococcus flocculiformis]|nr:MFS transporter [Trichococcus flocculiformis]